MISYASEMMISCAKKKISIWKWFFLNDLLPQKMISGRFLRKKNDLQVRKIISFQFRNDFLHKKMISKELKNDFREMIFGTFAAAFEDLI